MRRVLLRVFGSTPGVRWLVLAILLVVTACAVLARLVASADFHTFGQAAWWSVQTVTTVGYGDITPKTTAGRAVAAVLMIAAIAFISVLTAAISADFVNRVQARRGRSSDDRVLAALERLERRLDALGAPADDPSRVR